MNDSARHAAMYRAIEATDGMGIFLSRSKLVDILHKAQRILEEPWREEVDRLQDEIDKMYLEQHPELNDDDW